MWKHINNKLNGYNKINRDPNVTKKTSYRMLKKNVKRTVQKKHLNTKVLRKNLYQ